MSRQLSKRIKRNYRNRCLRKGLERLEVRNLLAADMMEDDFTFVPKEDPAVEEKCVEVAASVGDVDEATGKVEQAEDADPQDGEPKSEKELLEDEEPEVECGSSSEEDSEPSDEDPVIKIRTLESTDEPVVDEEFVEVEAVDGDPSSDQPIIYFRSLSGSAGDDEPAAEEVVEPEAFDGELFDDSVIFYTLSPGVAGETDGELVLEMVPDCGGVHSDGAVQDVVAQGQGVQDESVQDEVVQDDASDGEEEEIGEIRTLGGVGLDDPELLSATAVPFMSEWYNADNPIDTNGDGVPSPADFLIVVNAMSRFGSVRLSHAVFAQAEALDTDMNYRVDSNNDSYLSPIDGLLVLIAVNQESETGGTTDAPPDSAGDQGRLGAFASIRPDTWDEFEVSDDEFVLDDTMPAEDGGDDQSGVVFGARIRDPNADWSDEEQNDSEAGDKFWSEFAADDGSDSPLDEETLDIMARA